MVTKAQYHGTRFQGATESGLAMLSAFSDCELRLSELSELRFTTTDKLVTRCTPHNALCQSGAVLSQCNNADSIGHGGPCLFTPAVSLLPV
jgi:hypothetical protein